MEKEASGVQTHFKDTHVDVRLMITLPSHMLQNSIGLLQKTTLIGKFSSNSVPFFTIKNKAHVSWPKLRDILYIDSKSKCFIAIVESKASRDLVHKQKGWFFCGSSLYTLIWIPNFKPQSLQISFFPHWISFPSLPLEYKDAQIIEILANKLGIFLLHDLIPYD